MFFILFVCAATIVHSGSTQNLIKRFEYKVSFKPPNIFNSDGTNPFWEVGGNAIPSSKQIRLASSLPDQRGWMWSKRYLEASDWEIEVTFRIHSNSRTGGDGMAIWFTSEKGTDGPVFGSSDNWKGLGVFLDSYDNDLKNNNPLISVVLNNGSMSYDHERDGETQLIGGCISDYRNKPYPTSLKIEYVKKILTVYVNEGLSSPGKYVLCTRIENVELPERGYIGLSASTGVVFDEHEVFSLLVHVYVSQESAVKEDSEARKQLEDYLKRVETMKQAQEEYAKQHPERVKSYDDKVDTLFDRETQMLFAMQNEMRQTIDTILARMNELIGRQESLNSLVSRLSDGSLSKHSLGANVVGTGVGSIPSKEMQALLNHQRTTLDALNRLSASIQEMFLYLRNQPPSGSNSIPDKWCREVSEKLGLLVNRKAPREPHLSS